MCEKTHTYQFLLDPEQIGAPVQFPEFPELETVILDVSTMANNLGITFSVNGLEVRLSEKNKEHEIMIDHHSFYVEHSFTDTITKVNGLPTLRPAPLYYLIFSICRFAKGSTHCQVTDDLAHQVEVLWKSAFKDATLLPVVGLPSNNKGVLTLTHTDGSGKMLKINGLSSKSFLSNNALYSVECTEGKFINLYEIMLPDIAGVNGGESTMQFYTRQLKERGMTVAGSHFHWWGSALPGLPQHSVAAIHHQSTTTMDPIEFSRLTITALQATLDLIKNIVSINNVR